MPYDPTYHLPLRVDKIHAAIRAERPDVLEIHSPYVAALSCLTVRRKHYGIRTFQWHSDFIDTYKGALLQALSKPVRDRAELGVSLATDPLWGLVRQIASRCAATLVAARWQVSKLEAHGVARVRHMPFGIEHEIFTPGRRSEETRRELLRGRPGPLLVAIGRLAIEKRWDVVLDAFMRFRRDREGTLVVLGDGPERDRMEARVRGRDDVTFLGFQRDRARLATALASADLLVHGCPYETFGLSVAEALAAGLPCLVPHLGGAAELSDGEACVTYPAHDVEACAARIAELLARDPAALRDAAARRGAAFPSVLDQFRGQIALYEELARAS